MAADNGTPVANVIENMSAAVCDGRGAETPLFGRGGGGVLASAAGVPLLGQVPLDTALRAAGDRGVPVVRDAPDAPSARALVDVARSLPSVRRPLLGRPLELSVVGSGPAS